MCGIAGFVSLQTVPTDKAVLDRMISCIAHRGPDAGNTYTDDMAMLGHRRLSIVDLASGHQPMHNEDGNLWIVYNGEVFNHASLRPGLEAAGHVYTTRCDTEAILHSYEQYGASCMDRFRGMFAFAIWNRAARTLFCARDRLGIKPFYYFSDGRIFAFASEIKALLEHPRISAELESDAIGEYLAFGYTSGERTLYRNIRRLLPGHSLTVRTDGGQLSIATQQYWDIPAPPDRPESRSDEEWIRDCRGRLEETVQMRLMSDVPLGMFLSGGVDSSAIAALMSRMVEGRVKTFAVGYAEEQYSELGYARQVADIIGTDHHEVSVSMDDFFDALPRLIWHEDEPITWPSSVSLHFVSKLASEHVKVVLTGEGSDELFAGYGRYRFYLMNNRWLKPYSMLPGAVRGAIRGMVANSSLLSGNFRRKLQHTFIGRGESLESLYLDNFYSAFSAQAQQSLLKSGVRMPSPYDTFLDYWKRSPGSSPLFRMLYADQKTYLAELLMKQDQMSMSVSIESRVPFLDHTFVEFSTRVPEHLKLRGTTGKYILKKSVEDLLPESIIYRKKMGFPTPLRSWLMQPRAASLYDLLRRRDSVVSEYFDSAAVNGLISQHLSGQYDHTDALWRLLNLQLWGEIVLHGRDGLIHEGIMNRVAARAY